MTEEQKRERGERERERVSERKRIEGSLRREERGEGRHRSWHRDI